MKKYIKTTTDNTDIDLDQLIEECVQNLQSYLAIPEVNEYFSLYGLDTDLVKQRLTSYLQNCSERKLQTILYYGDTRMNKYGDIGLGFFEVPDSRPGSLRFGARLDPGNTAYYLWDYRFDNPNVSTSARRQAAELIGATRRGMRSLIRYHRF